MSEIPEDIKEAAYEAWISAWGMAHGLKETGGNAFYLPIAQAISAERNRCISIAQSIEPHNEAEAHLIETIVRRMRGSE